VQLKTWTTLLRVLGGLRVPRKFQLRTTDLEAFQHVLVVLNKHSMHPGEVETPESVKVPFHDQSLERLQIAAPPKN